MKRALVVIALGWSLISHTIDARAEQNAPISIADVNAIFNGTTRSIRAALNAQCVKNKDKAALAAEVDYAIDRIDKWAFDNPRSPNFQEANDRAAVLRGLARQLASKPICLPQAGQPNPPPPVPGGGIGLPSGYLCFSIEAQIELKAARAQLTIEELNYERLVEKQKAAQANLKEAQAAVDAAKRALEKLNNAATTEEIEQRIQLHLARRKAEELVEAATGELSLVNQDIVEARNHIRVLKVSILALEDLPPCPPSWGQVFGGDQLSPKDGKKIDGNGQDGAEPCGAGSQRIKELEDEIARLTRQNDELISLLADLIRALAAINRSPSLSPEAKKARSDALAKDAQDATEQRARNTKAIEMLKKKLEAANKPCPPPGKTIGASFQGPFFGAMVAAAIGHSRWTESGGGTDRFAINGFMVGLTAGYDIAAGPMVIGVIGDIGWGNIDGTTRVNCETSCRTRIGWLATLRGRVGAPVTVGGVLDTIMPYITAGLAMGRLHADVGSFPGGSSTPLGWIGGLGVDATLLSAPTSGIARVGIRLEALWFDFGSPRLCTVATCGGSAKIKASGALFRAGIDIHL